MIRIMNNYGAPKIMTTCEISSQLFSDIISGFEQFRHQASQGGRNNQGYCMKNKEDRRNVQEFVKSIEGNTKLIII